MSQQQIREIKLPDSALEKINAAREQKEASKIEREWRLLAELGMYYGWQAVRDVRQNEVDIDTFNMMIKAGRKVEAQKTLDYAHATFGAVAATKSKNPSSALKKVLKHFYKEAE